MKRAGSSGAYCALLFFCFVSAAGAQALAPIDTKDLPRLAISIGHIEAGLRYRLTADSSVKVTSTRSVDYKNERKSTFDYDFRSTSTLTEKTASNLGFDLKLSLSKDFKVGFGGSVKTDTTDERKNVWENHQRLDAIITATNSAGQVLSSEEFQKAALGENDGFLTAEITITNYENYSIALTDINFSIISSDPFRTNERTIMNGVIGVNTSSVPGAPPAAAGGATKLTISPISASGEPFRYVIYVESRPTALIKELLTNGSVFSLQINSIKYLKGDTTTEISVTDRLAELKSTAVSVRVIDGTTDNTTYYPAKDAAGQPVTPRLLLKALDPGVDIKTDGGVTYLNRLLGRTTKFRAWSRELAIKRATRKQLDDFRAAAMTEGAWTATWEPREALGQPDLDTPLGAGDRLDLVYLTKAAIVKAEIDEDIRGTNSVRTCAIDAKPQFIPSFCTSNVRSGDIVRLEAKAWASSTGTIEKPTDVVAAAFQDKAPSFAPAFVKSSLTTAKATLSQLDSAVVGLDPNDVIKDLQLKIGDTPARPIGDLINSGLIAAEASADGWFALNFSMPATLTDASNTVCIADAPSTRKLKIGRILNMAPPELNDNCPPSGCVPWHAFALGWKKGNPQRDRDTYDQRFFKVVIHHFRKLRNETEYLTPPQGLSPKIVEDFINTDTVPTIDDGPTEFCPVIRFTPPPIPMVAGGLAP
ncbi:hypothetical protein [Bradyrhizobium acaciae]|uniref:hypothetical protein n=1 Tax=Bradyrhizobium acaciae TaxID=2683706 RepID=UPI001E40CB18|nr:hypothetical protein [Bradyrhizobium acaciae]MCC8981599.1 hypothetical protein [Bradyrhizobium acaciae]